ncbi:hypothetical protein BKH46_01290 [Helicobacter sp. 12S02634-8]|uniref:FecCD family ABC transporter permease n=1 Tax=Helicobacter sp. 12S02634-8 TaxID=1476199 RepID=UPI000BA74BC8|nr:iron ABC transporter permease [Helicobacter sp. 12S02634-8]PAF48565.1 hypothetical protein BKH46_01290 [Helicobacter sp. 12S02634-8]
MMIKMLFLWLFLIGLCVFSLGVGRYAISWEQIACFVMQWFGANQCMQGGLENQIILNLRLPRIVLGVFVGLGLGASGASFQSVFKNPLATPDILGVTSGASFGAVLGLLLGLGKLGMIATSLGFGFLALGLAVLIARGSEGYGTIMLVLGGIVVSALFQSFLSLIKYVADPQDVLPAITYWLLGSLQVSGLSEIYLGIIGICAGSVLIYLFSWRLNILALDDDEARSLGICLSGYRALFIGASTLIVVFVVSMCGLIGWVGLLIPHIARLLCGSNNAKVIPLSLVLGAIFMVLIDLLARTLSAEEIPVSILSALVGAPFFIYILKINKGMRL